MDGRRISIRRGSVAAFVTAAVVLIAGIAHAAEVVAAELEGTVNEVTVEQGQTATFTISVRATGMIKCTATPSNPARATFTTEYGIDEAGVLSSGPGQTPTSFWADHACRVTWEGAPDAMLVTATIHADADAPLGSRLARLRASVFTPPGSGQLLRDDTNDFLRFTVVPGSDVTPPTVDCAGPAGTPGEGGWYTSDVSWACAASDAGSGLADAADSSFTLATSGEGSVSTGARTVADAAGNEATVGPFGPYDVDLNDPVAHITAPAATAAYVLGSEAVAAFECTDTEAGSGVAACVTADTLDTGSVGWKSFTVTATDRAGRTSATTHWYHVVYDFSGLSLVGDNPYKAGQTVPMSWSLDGIGDLDTVESLTVAPCDEPDAREQLAMPGGSGLFYNAAADTFHVNWKTQKAWGAGCRQIQLALDDGEEHRLNVMLR